MAGKLLLLSIGLVLGSFAAEAIRVDPDWDRAFDRSYFQLIALLMAWVVLHGQ